jgi:rSAM/selenodomain-associated transferase 1
VSVSQGPPVGGRRILIVAKAPANGRSKTRLVPPLDASQATVLQQALLLDTIDACRREVDDVRLLVADPADVAPLASLCPGLPIETQAGRGLADALRLGLAQSLAAAGPTAIVASDLPGTPPGELRRAFALLDAGADVVLGPATDGGYWLFAAREAQREPFRDIPWSTPAALAVTVDRCRAAGLRVELLRTWRDVDTAADLAALASEPALAAAVRTAAAIAGRDPAGGDVPTLLETTFVRTSPWRTLLVDRLGYADGSETEYSYIATPRAAFIVPITPAGDVVLVRQYRHPVRDFTLEVPAGAVDEGETPRQAAERELLEEVGGASDDVEHLATFYSSSAHLTLRSDAFLARDVVLGEPDPGARERVSPVLMPFDSAVREAREGRMPEGQTALVLLLAAARIGRP